MYVMGGGGSREPKVDTLSKGKTIPYGRTRGILFREKKQSYTRQDFLTRSLVPTKEYIPICLIK